MSTSATKPRAKKTPAPAGSHYATGSGVVKYYVHGPQEKVVSTNFTAANLVKVLEGGLPVTELTALQTTLEVPADKRFYSGGGGSVRGFAFQMAGPLDQDDDPVGGRSLVEASMELRWRFWDSFGLVPFVDAGNVYEEVYPSFDDGLFWGAGLGFRYYTRVGPIRLDIATPINPRDGVDDPVQFYISLGQAY